MDTSPLAIMALPVIVGVVEVIKRAGLPGRWLPLVALVLGVTIGVAGALVRSGTMAEGMLTGVLWGATLGLGAVGLYSGASSVMGK